LPNPPDLRAEQQVRDPANRRRGSLTYPASRRDRRCTAYATATPANGSNATSSALRTISAPASSAPNR